MNVCLLTAADNASPLCCLSLHMHILFTHHCYDCAKDPGFDAAGDDVPRRDGTARRIQNDIGGDTVHCLC